jgi:DNA-binding beta-propeller fold protein YncE
MLDMMGLTVDPVNGVIYVSEAGAECSTACGSIRKVSGLITGDIMVTTIGFGQPTPFGLAIDVTNQILYFATFLGSSAVHAYDMQNRVGRVVAGGCRSAVVNEAIGTNFCFGGPQGLALSNNGKELFVAEGFFGAAVRRINLATQSVTNLVGDSDVMGNVQSGVGAGAKVPVAFGVAVHPDTDEVYVSLQGSAAIMKVSLRGKAVFVTPRTNTKVDAIGLNARFGSIGGIAFDKQDNLIVADELSNQIRMVAKNGAVTTIAGSGDPEPPPGFLPGWVSATSANLNTPSGVAVDLVTGLIYISDTDNFVIRRLDPLTKKIEVFAGTGVQENSDGDRLEIAGFKGPGQVRVPRT